MVVTIGINGMSWGFHGGPKGARPKNKGRPGPKAAPEVKEEEGSWVAGLK